MSRQGKFERKSGVYWQYVLYRPETSINKGSFKSLLVSGGRRNYTTQLVYEPETYRVKLVNAERQI